MVKLSGMTWIVLLSLALVVIVLLLQDSGPEEAPNNIASLSSEPEKHRDRTIRISGAVSSVIKLPMVGSKAYWITDGTGEIAVTTDQSVPLPRDRVQVTGHLEPSAIIGTNVLGWHLVEVTRSALDR